VSIYKPCDIRGNVTGELTIHLYRRWGIALGLQVPPGEKFIVGGDVRESTPAFLASLVDGLCEAGVSVVNLGRLPTPMIYHARRRIHAAAAAIVTASHNPADINGLKWTIGGKPPTPADVAALEEAAQSPPCCDREPTEARRLDVTFDYVAWLQETFVDSLSARCHVVLDPLYGCWSAKARRYLHAIFPQCFFTALHDEPDKQFGGRLPDCSRRENLLELGEAVYRERADLGIAFDGDGDRVALVDGNGDALTGEETTWALLQTYGQELQGKPFVYDQKFSDRIPETARRLGAEPLVERSGHAFIRTRMQESEAPFGAEVSGHYFFGELGGGDDGLLAACRMIAFLTGTGQTLLDLRRECPEIFMTPDLRVPLDVAAQQETIERVRAAWSDYPQKTLDGIRIDTPAGWGLIRPSVTEPALTFRFESVDWLGLEDLVDRFCDTLGEVGDRLRTSYEIAMGRE